MKKNVFLSLLGCILISLYLSCGINELNTAHANSAEIKNVQGLGQRANYDSFGVVQDRVGETGQLKKSENDSLLKHPYNQDDPYGRPYYHLSYDLIDDHVYYVDTVVVKTGDELAKKIKSNRLVQLVNSKYILSATLKVEGLKNLKIVGAENSIIQVENKNGSVLEILNSHNICLENLIIGEAESSVYIGGQGVVSARYCYNIDILNCTLLSAATFGLVTYAVYNITFVDSEITACSSLLFDIERSRKIMFVRSKFHHNHLSISVLGGFSNACKDLKFLDCQFVNNQPELIGNPVFNQRDLYEPITFINCTFKENKGYKWYGDFIKLINCQVDSSDFISFH